MADLDNYAYPLAYHLKDPGLVSVWCTKQHHEQSFVRIEAAREIRLSINRSAGRGNDRVGLDRRFQGADPRRRRRGCRTASRTRRLELAFVVGPRRNWLNLWKQTIDSLDPLLGRTRPDRDWHPLDGRITELGMHRTVDPGAGNEVVVGIAAQAL